jgi:hypothetical protein
MGRHAELAPIGARVFAIERRNHSKTGVYELPCMRVPVDMITPTDKMGKAKKGFKFERFDVFIRIERSHSGRRVWEGRKAREATRMGGLPFDSILPDRSQPLRLRALQNGSNSSSSSSTAVIQSRSASRELTDISSLLFRFRTEPQFRSRPSTHGLEHTSKHDVAWAGLRCNRTVYCFRATGGMDSRPGRYRVRHTLCSMDWV